MAGQEAQRLQRLGKFFIIGFSLVLLSFFGFIGGIADVPEGKIYIGVTTDSSLEIRCIAKWELTELSAAHKGTSPELFG